MMRWILLFAVLGGMYWLYQRDYAERAAAPAVETRAAAPSATLPPGKRLGGGLNPFVTDSGVDTPPQRPRVP